MKKILLVFMMISFSLVLLGCDFLSTVVALKGFNDEYNALMPIYESSSKIKMTADASLTVKEASFTHTGPSNFQLVIEDDVNVAKTQIDYTIDGVHKKSQLLYVDDIGVEYEIKDNVVTPIIREESDIAELLDAFSSGSFEFSLEHMENQRKTGDRQYELDVMIDKFASIEIVNAIIMQFKFPLLPESIFVNIPANVKVSFFDENHRIHFVVKMTDQTFTFADESTATISLQATITMELLQSVNFIDVFADTLTFKPVDDIRLALKPYSANKSIVLPITANQPGYLRFVLEPGTYTIQSNQYSNFNTSILMKADQVAIAINPATRVFTIEEAGVYYYYLQPKVTQSITLEFRKNP